MIRPTAPASQPCDVPPWLDDDSAFVIVDWSSLIHRAWHVGEVEMLPHVVGWLCGMLAYSPAHLVIALDAPGKTRRHRAVHPTDPDWRYKGDRPAKPELFGTMAQRATEIAELHAIPCLWSPEEEADDVIATVTAQASELGYRVWIATTDKDLHGLVAEGPTEDGSMGLTVGTWDRFQGPATGRCGSWRGPAEVRARWGVEPAQMADLLAIAGDVSDGIPGVIGIGEGKASAILRSYGTLDRALTERPWGPEKFKEAEKEIAALAKLGKTDPKALTGRADLMARRVVERDRVRVVGQTELARFSRSLTALDCGLDLRVPWEDTAIGGFDVEALRRRYLDLGYTRRASEVTSYPKRPPWATPRVYARAG